MFIAALFTIARTWKQPKCFINRGMDKYVVYIHIYVSKLIYSGILLSHKKRTKEQNHAICSNMDISRDHHTV